MSTYAISDLHGCYNIYEQVKAFIKPEDKVICIGDCGDRGYKCWETIKAVAADPQFIYLKGNHEDMLMRAMEEYHLGHCYWDNCNLCSWNGGDQTLQSWSAEGEDMKWVDFIKNLPLFYVYTNTKGEKILLNHSGCDEGGSEEEILWDRKHFYHYTSDFDYIVHGHTPAMYIEEDLTKVNEWLDDDKKEIINPFVVGQPYFYCENKKIDIDSGTFFTGKSVLLNLDDFTYTTFIDLNIKPEEVV